SAHFLIIICFFLFSRGAQGQANVKGKWNTLPYQMPINPVHMALMNNGKVLVISGSGNVPGNLAFQSGVWDPLAGTFSTFGGSWDMFCNGITVMADGRPLIAGGTLQYDPFRGARNAALFDPSTSSFTDLDVMVHGRWYPTTITLSDGRALVYSGINE